MWRSRSILAGVTSVRRNFYAPFCDVFYPPKLGLSVAMRADDGLTATSGGSIIQGSDYMWVSSGCMDGSAIVDSVACGDAIGKLV
jgi:hypothetical protein